MANRIVLLVVVLLIGISVGLQASDVPLDFPSIQAAIDASNDGDTIIVAPGEYHERLNFNGHNVILASQYVISGDTAIISQTIIDGDSLGTVVTFENGENDPAAIIGFTITRGAAIEGAGIKCVNGSSPRIEANKITENYAEINGAGIYCAQNSNPYVLQNKISGNKAAGIVWGVGGGAIYCQSSSPKINNNEINGNFAGSGAGILCVGSNAEIANNHIFENTLLQGYALNQGAGIDCINQSEPIIRANVIERNTGLPFGYGGGVNFSLSGGILEENTIDDNTADAGGGITVIEQGYPIIRNNLITNNSDNVGAGITSLISFPTIVKNKIMRNHSGAAGGIFLQHGGGLVANNIIAYNICDYGMDCGGIEFSGHINVAIINNLIYGNSSPGAGGIQGFAYQDSTYIINNIIWGNQNSQTNLTPGSTFEVKYNDIQGGYEGEGNIDLDPLFRDTTNADFHLLSIACGDAFDSPVIDMGDPRISDDLLDCIHGLGTQTSDLGAYGGGFNYIAGDANGNGVANGIDVTFMLNYLKFGVTPPRSYYCPHYGYIYAGADANGNCIFNGIDITYMVNYLKGFSAPKGCPDCPAGGLNR